MKETLIKAIALTIPMLAVYAAGVLAMYESYNVVSVGGSGIGEDMM